ncbi:MAG: general secretion pathway protein GspB [Steroidobacteraceae bacterium]
MSFILDALRKSEIERQRQSGPSIAELPVARDDRRLPVALLAIGVLLAVNVGVLLFFLLRDGAEPAAPEPAGNMAAANGAAAPVVHPAAAMPAPAVVTPPQTESPPMQVAVAPFESATLPPAAPDPTLLPDAPVAAPKAGVTYTPAPVAADPLAAQAAGLPELTVDLHVFTDDPARRAVFINGRRYTQGATILEGPVVEEITRDGAVLNYRGRRFLLPRL